MIRCRRNISLFQHDDTLVESLAMHANDEHDCEEGDKECECHHKCAGAKCNIKDCGDCHGKCVDVSTPNSHSHCTVADSGLMHSDSETSAVLHPTSHCSD